MDVEKCDEPIIKRKYTVKPFPQKMNYNIKF